MRAKRRAQSSERGVITTFNGHLFCSSCGCIKRLINFLCYPDAMEQNSQLSRDGNDGSSVRVTSAACAQTEAPST